MSVGTVQAAALRGQLYGPGLAPAGVPATFTASALGLEFVDDHAGVSVPTWHRLAWRRGGFNDSQLIVEWTTDAGAHSLAVSDAAAQSALLAHLAPSTRAASGPSRGTRTASNAVITVLVVVPLLLVGLLVWQADRLIDWAVAKIPVETEIKLGREAFAQQRTRLTLDDAHPAAAMVREIGARLGRGSAYPYEFHIARDATANAFAMPGGFVVIHTGLLARADSAEELAGVMAHEIQHVERRHGLRGLVHAAGWRVVLSVILGDTGGSLAASWVENLGALRFSRSQETDADLQGVQALVRADIDPRGMATFFRKMAADGSAMPELLSSHPASESRFAEVEAAMPKDRVFPKLDYDYARLRGAAK